MMDIGLFIDMLSVDSTSTHERGFADFLAERLRTDDVEITRYPADAPADEPVNLMLAWGEPKVVYCTHLDTVPPYIPPTIEQTPDGRDTIIRGRGACDAKGQIFAMYSACKKLAQEGNRGFGLLLLYGEETGSYGAKAYRHLPGAEYVIVGEPTDGCMVKASKGTKAFEIEIRGRAFHSGYPEYGDSAVERFIDLVQRLRSIRWPEDAELGATTYNIGKLISENPQNTLSPLLQCRIYFRTTFATDAMVGEEMERLCADEAISLKAMGGDTPMHYLTLDGFPTKTVAFGSDAPQLTNFRHRALCGPGSILVAHRDEECITMSEIEEATNNYIKMFHQLYQRT